MGLSGKDVLRLAVDADSSAAVKEFDKLGREIKRTVGDADKGATGLKQKFGNAFQGLADRSTIASGALNKLGVSGQQAGMAIASAIPAAGVAAAGALALFAVKGVQAFTSTALAAGKFADATGLSVEEASKWVAVADDVGVSGQTMQSAFIKMEKAIDSNRGAFGDLVATAKDGSVDMSQTFLNVITHLQGIEDPIKRANEASKFFGRGFAEVAIINTDAATISASLAAVSEEEIIDEKELGKAHDYRAAMDQLNDSVRKLSISLGGPLTDSFSAVASGTAAVVDGLNAIGDGIGEAFLGGALGNAKNAWNSPFGGGGEDVDKATAAVGRFATAENLAAAAGNHLSLAHAGTAAAVTAVSTSFGNFEARAAAAGFAMGRQADETNRANSALQGLLNTQLAEIDASFAVTNATNNFLTANENAAKAVDDTNTAVNEQQVAYDRATQEAVNAAGATVALAEKQAGLEGKTLSAKDSQDILIGKLMELASKSSGPVAASIGGVITKLQAVGAQKPNPTINATDHASPTIGNVKRGLDGLDGRSVTSSINVLTGGALNSIANIQNAFNRLPKNFTGLAGASGFQNFSGGVALVGEEGPELAYLPKGTDLFTASQTRGMLTASATPTAPSLPASIGGSSSATVVNFNGTFLTSKAELGRMVDEALAESRRRGNRAA